MPRLLMLLEPQPIRNTFGAMAWIGDSFIRMLLAEGGSSAAADVRVAGNGPTLIHVAGLHPAGRPYLLGLPLEIEESFASSMADWHTQGLQEWTTIQLGSPVHLPRYVALLTSLRDAYPFEALAYWGTNETLRQAAASLDVPVLWAEYGPMRPPFETRFCLDAEGVNGHAPGRDNLRLRTVGSKAALPGPSLCLDVGGVSAYEAALMLSSSAGAQCFVDLMRFSKGQDRVVLLVGQLADDASLISFGRGWTPHEAVRHAVDLMAGPGTVFILRPHPGEAVSYHNAEAGRRLRGIVENRKDVFVVEEGGDAAYAACIAVASEVVAVNSSVCFEAMLSGKLVRVLGSASFMPPDSKADFPHGPVQLECPSIEVLLNERFIPSSVFWTKRFWMDKVAQVVTVPSFPAMLPRLPTSPAKVLGRVIDQADGILGVDGIGPLPLLPPGDIGAGSFDEAKLSDSLLSLHGWAVDGRTGGMTAGFILTTGEHSIWSSAVSHRVDVARHRGSAEARAAGFRINVSISDMPSATCLPIRAYAVLVTGHCHLVARVQVPQSDGSFLTQELAA